MILLDTNIVLDSRDSSSPFRVWAARVIEQGVTGDGAAINAVSLAELAVGAESNRNLVKDLADCGIMVLDLPAAAAIACGAAYRKYRVTRLASGGGPAPVVPLPDFFIGAHAELMTWSLATRDSRRFRIYFPKVRLIEP